MQMPDIPSSHNSAAKHFKSFLMFFLIAQLLTIMGTIQLLFESSRILLVRPLITWNLWGIFAFGLYIRWRSRIETGAYSSASVISSLLLWSPAIIPTYVCLQSLLLWAAAGGPSRIEEFVSHPRLIVRGVYAATTYIVLVASAWTYSRFRSLELKKIESSTLETELSRVKLKMIKNELRIRKLLQSLKFIKALLPVDKLRAEAKTARLAKSIRKSLRSIHLDPFFETDFHLSMAETRPPKVSPWKKTLTILGLFTGLILIFILGDFAETIVTGSTLSWSALILQNIPWYSWALLAAYICFAERIFPLEGSRMRIHAVIHLLNSVFTSLAANYIIVSFQNVLIPGDQHTVSSVFSRALAIPLVLDATLYWGIIAVIMGLRFSFAAQQQRIRSSELEATIHVTQLNLLKMQLHPHFLFNTLNSVCELIHEDGGKAETILSDIESFIQNAVNLTNQQEVTLGQELDALRSYIEIQQTRFEEKLDSSVEIDGVLQDVLVPHLILQPLVENAIRHGLRANCTKIQIWIRAKCVNETIRLEIHDNGCGLPQNYREGIGLSNTRRRLKALYGNKQSLTILNSENGGVSVTVHIPIKKIA